MGLGKGDFHLKGCRLEGSQSWGSVRLAAIIRDEIREDLRLAEQGIEGVRQVRSTYRSARYQAYMPQGMVVQWNPNGAAVSTEQTHMGKYGTLAHGSLWKRLSNTELAFLPQNLAIEGFLVRHFKGPEIAWLDYRREVRRGNLGIRYERSMQGWLLKGLEEALARFEFAPDQVGSALFLDEELINCLVTPHPQDYARLHESLLLDHYPEYLINYGFLRSDKSSSFPLATHEVRDLESLEREFQAAKQRTAEEQMGSLEDLLARTLDVETLYTTDTFRLERFVSEIEGRGNFAGERILREDGTLEYLKLFRLSRAQSRRLHLLSNLAAQDWDLKKAAPALKLTDQYEVARSLAEADLGYLLNPELYGRVGVKP